MEARAHRPFAMPLSPTTTIIIIIIAVAVLGRRDPTKRDSHLDETRCGSRRNAICPLTKVVVLDETQARLVRLFAPDERCERPPVEHATRRLLFVARPLQEIFREPFGRTALVFAGALHRLWRERGE
eukprot:102832-Pleurochrysis_carterae.AAC.1